MKHEGFTPGPWRVYLRTRVVANVRHAGMHGSLQDAVADFRDGANAEANANLIADAPALLARVERLEAALEIVTAFDKWPANSVPLGRGAEAFAEIARAALADKE